MCTFGNFEKVTKVFLTSYFVKLLKKTDLTNEKEYCILTIIAFICMTTFCLNSIKYIQIIDLKFKLEQVIQSKKKNKNFTRKKQIQVVGITKMKKDKHLLKKDHNIPIQSSSDLTSDFFIMFMTYL